jgi:hypothetical protein
MSRERDRPFLPSDSDGCTIISRPYNKIRGKNLPQRSCCDKHDEAYWYGGTHEQRLWADTKLRDCVAALGDNELERILFWFIAQIMYYAVRVGGSPKLPFPWRWRYSVGFKLKDLKSGYLPKGREIDYDLEQLIDRIRFDGHI